MDHRSWTGGTSSGPAVDETTAAGDEAAETSPRPGRPMAAARALDRYQDVACIEADPVRRVILLFDGAIRFLHRAASAIDAGDVEVKTERVDRALRIIGYLRSRLDLERGGETAALYDRLYADVGLRALRASARLDAEAMRRVADLLAPVRAAWAEHAMRGRGDDGAI